MCNWPLKHGGRTFFRLSNQPIRLNRNLCFNEMREISIKTQSIKTVEHSPPKHHPCSYNYGSQQFLRPLGRHHFFGFSDFSMNSFRCLAQSSADSEICFGPALFVE